MKIGDKVNIDNEGKTQAGVIHGVSKSDLGKGEVVVGYLVDVTDYEKRKKSKNKDHQDPEIVNVVPENISSR
jgi:hypothetical protein